MPDFDEQEFDWLVAGLKADEDPEAKSEDEEEEEVAESTPQVERRAILQGMVDENGPDAALAIQLLDAMDERARSADLAAQAAETEDLQKTALELVDEAADPRERAALLAEFRRLAVIAVQEQSERDAAAVERVSRDLYQKEGYGRETIEQLLAEDRARAADVDAYIATSDPAIQLAAFRDREVRLAGEARARALAEEIRADSQAWDDIVAEAEAGIAETLAAVIADA